MQKFQCLSFVLNPLTTNVPHHMETSQLICNENDGKHWSLMG